MATQGERVTNVHCTDDCVVVDLADGRTISAPLLVSAAVARDARTAGQLAGCRRWVRHPLAGDR